MAILADGWTTAKSRTEQDTVVPSLVQERTRLEKGKTRLRMKANCEGGVVGG